MKRDSQGTGSQYKKIIGIDPGRNNGVAIMYEGKYHRLTTIVGLHMLCEFLAGEVFFSESKVLIVLEDARLISGPDHKKLGAGSVRAICREIETFVKQLPEADLIKRKPVKNGTKLSKELFVKVTGYTKQTSSHSRDAAMLIHSYHKK